MPGRKISQTLWVPALHLLTGLLACGSESPVAMPLADVTGATEGPVENTEITLVDCCTRAATLQQLVVATSTDLTGVSAKMVTVSVTGPGGTLTLSGYRANY